jgi:hypothetical protein
VTNGNVSFQLQTPPAEYLEQVQVPYGRDCTVSPADLKYFTISNNFYFSADDGNEYRLGVVAFKNGVQIASDGAGEIGYRISGYMYFNKAGKMSCRVEDEYGIYITNVNASPGWVRWYEKRDRTKEKMEITMTTDPSILPEGVELRWVARILEGD